MEPDLAAPAFTAVPDGVTPALRVNDLTTGYGKKTVVYDASFHVLPGEIVGVFGHNGAGKSTIIRTILGANPVGSGTIEYFGRDVTGRSPKANVGDGMALIPSERFVFADLTVRDNLLLGTAADKDAGDPEQLLESIYDVLPILRERQSQLAGTMSGGQQRMVSLGLALMTRPRLLMLDEPSLGLAPAIVQQIFERIRHLATHEDLSVVLLEQNVGAALKIVDRVYVVRSGRFILEETVEQMRARESYWDLF